MEPSAKSGSTQANVTLAPKVITCFGAQIKNSFAQTEAYGTEGRAHRGAAGPEHVPAPEGGHSHDGQGGLAAPLTDDTPLVPRGVGDARLRASHLGSYKIIDAPLPAHRRKLLEKFVQYLDSTARIRFNIYSTTTWQGHTFDQPTVNQIPYVHRWHPLHAKATIAKLYQLENHHNEHPRPVWMLTLTTYHDRYKSGRKATSEAARGMTIETGFEILKAGWRAITKWARRHRPDLSFVYFYEAHETGYPHLHVAFFGEPLMPAQQDHLSRYWAAKGYGSKTHGLKFSIEEKGGIRSIRNYITKYISKGFRDGDTGSRYGHDAWHAGDWLFNAIAWENRWRLWGSSRDLSHIMARRAAPVDDELYRDWTKTTILTEHGDEHTLNTRDASLDGENHDSTTDTRNDTFGPMPDHGERLPRRLSAPPTVQSLLSDRPPDAARDGGPIPGGKR